MSVRTGKIPTVVYMYLLQKNVYVYWFLELVQVAWLLPRGTSNISVGHHV